MYPVTVFLSGVFAVVSAVCGRRVPLVSISESPFVVGDTAQAMGMDGAVKPELAVTAVEPQPAAATESERAFLRSIGLWPGLAEQSPAITAEIEVADATGPVVNLYCGLDAKTETPSGVPLALSIDTDYPRDGHVRIAVSPAAPETFTLRLRIPAWSANTAVAVNGDAAFSRVAPETRPEGRIPVSAGAYLELRREWRAGDVVTLDFDMRCRLRLGGLLGRLAHPHVDCAIRGIPVTFAP